MSAYYERVYVTFDVDLVYLYSYSADCVCGRITSSYCSVAALSEFDIGLKLSSDPYSLSATKRC